MNSYLSRISILGSILEILLEQPFLFLFCFRNVDALYFENIFLAIQGTPWFLKQLFYIRVA